MTKGKYQGIYNLYGSVIIPTQYTSIYKEGGKYLVENDSLKGIVNAYGSTVIPCKYNTIEYEDGVYYVSAGGKYGIYNTYGTSLPIQFYPERRETISGGE